MRARLEKVSCGTTVGGHSDNKAAASFCSDRIAAKGFGLLLTLEMRGPVQDRAGNRVTGTAPFNYVLEVAHCVPGGFGS